ncbi:DEAD/DEAH box helicase [Spirosoma rhododendri]|uniref:DEAD/DEAH box helicase n=1 Tax=Spirosoma rhododendri TaxID=2728024 RepID=A0A7L5DSX1_9BACT|nr:DEAD/DEAH box helicase [Spirosoma rhododendri]QJD79067.1 DEAD/DEAH box helicase [Spirosoma rhododendri]
MKIINKYSVLEESYPDLLDGANQLVQKAKISERFKNISLNESDIEELETIKEICEISIIERWNAGEDEELKTLCSVYYDIASLLELPKDPILRVFECIKLIAISYVGESWHLVKKFLKNNQNEFFDSKVDDVWNKKLLENIFFALYYTVKKDSWEDLKLASKYISSLRERQKELEIDYLEALDLNEKKPAAAELISLYHLAKSVDLLAVYLIDGSPNNVLDQLRYHLSQSEQYAQEFNDYSLSLLIQYFEPFSDKIVKNSLWYITRGTYQRIDKFNEYVTKRENDPIFELLYPQREAILKGRLLDDAYDAIVVNLPTSSGKTLIAEYRILKAINQFSEQGGWVAYVVPTRALVNQIATQLKRDLQPVGIKVEKLSGALDIDGFEDSLLTEDTNHRQFDVLVTTYEKLQILIRREVGTKAERPLVLVVVDEAHNLEEETRGIALELLLTLIKKECNKANFLLLTPEIKNSDEIAKWLGAERGSQIHLGLNWWQPNERIIGAVSVEGSGRNFSILLNTLFTEKGTYEVSDKILMTSFENAAVTKSSLFGGSTKSAGRKTILSAYLASSFIDENSIVLVGTPEDTFTVAESIWSLWGNNDKIDNEVQLVKKYVSAELGSEFPLNKFLDKGIGIHSSTLPEDIKFLIEDLMSKGKLRVLVATTTIAQGINFPVTSVIMASYSYPFKRMPVRDFWNIVGRVGRTSQKNIGFVGITLKNDAELDTVAQYVLRAADDLKSRLIDMVKEAMNNGFQNFEKLIYFEPHWTNLLQFISHLHKQAESLDQFLASLEIDLQSTLGYKQLDEPQKKFIRENLRQYAKNIKPAEATLSDATRFSTISVRTLISGLGREKLVSSDWDSKRLFSNQNSSLNKLVGLMLSTPEVRQQLEEIKSGDSVLDRTSISRLITDWVSGETIEKIAQKYFAEDSSQKSIEKCTKAIYRNITNAATWGLAGLQKLPNSGLEWDSLSDIDKRRLSNLPAMIHYGVNSDEAILMRKNNVPRSIASRIGKLFDSSNSNIYSATSDEVTSWLHTLKDDQWSNPDTSNISGNEYKMIWKKLSGSFV